MIRTLTPYDTGARLEPQLWPILDEDSFGRVDFDDDEGRTQFTTYVGRTPDGYTLHVENISARILIRIEGGPLAEGIAELINLAARGRADFKQQARYGDYDDAEQADAQRRWGLAQAAAAALAPSATDQPQQY